MDFLYLSNLKKRENYTDDNYVPEKNFSVWDVEGEVMNNVNNQLHQSSLSMESNGTERKETKNETINNVVAVAISVISAYLAWTCNTKMAFGKRLAMTILAFLFGMFYLVYAISFITTQCSGDSVNITSVAAPSPSFGYYM
jgi:hypothetical protein